MNKKFSNLWFDPTGNRTRVNRFSSRLFIHLKNETEALTALKTKGRDYFTRNSYLLFYNSDPNITQTPILTQKLTPNPIVTPTLTQTLRKVSEKCADKYFSFPFHSPNLKIFVEVVILKTINAKV